jgi:hypothetical protein
MKSKNDIERELRAIETVNAQLREQLADAREQLASAREYAEMEKKHASETLGVNRTLADERDKLRRENGKLRRLSKALRDALVVATEEDAPQAIPFGLL